jgi:hypothetical protein
MNMQTTRDGIFDLQISSEDLAIGLRRTKSNKLDSPGMVECQGVIGQEGILQKIKELVRSFSITSNFPFPQLFIDSKVILLCTADTIYEYVNGELSIKFSTSAGSKWGFISVGNFIYMSNGRVVIIRDPDTLEFYQSTDYPTATCICNYNGQVIIGAPNAGYYLGD